MSLTSAVVAVVCWPGGGPAPSLIILCSWCSQFPGEKGQVGIFLPHTPLRRFKNSVGPPSRSIGSGREVIGYRMWENFGGGKNWRIW